MEAETPQQLKFFFDLPAGGGKVPTLMVPGNQVVCEKCSRGNESLVRLESGPGCGGASSLKPERIVSHWEIASANTSLGEWVQLTSASDLILTFITISNRSTDTDNLYSQDTKSILDFF